MNTPGFNAEASLSLSLQPYSTLSSQALGSLHLALPALRNGGGNGGPPPPRCTTTCGRCDANCGKVCTVKCTDGTTTSFSRSCCGTGFTCEGGACICSGTVCGGACVDTSTDPSNCGQCGNACPTGATCQQGGCFPTPPVCGPCTNGFIECCSLVSPDQRECGLSTCCQTFTGPCTGAGGSDQCVRAGGTTQCCHSNWLWGWSPWITVCGEFTATGTAVQVTQGCNGPCW